ncbi:MAG: thiosulfate sulfurtransferase GlpE [Aliidiomarina sp.]|uniref:thiosulfate sulfurtransferase GlpE n=1 Tax=Aliidiomarina sp. TaxID=1872439 RepID=UPI0025C498D9|nr:thiosulfate sulfurtransferase GlpE [Aliidiomarina sp.]MCH8501675.1 thiosulfate sulfurtransferase GlpE [Aliidiomarina sp.]
MGVFQRISAADAQAMMAKGNVQVADLRDPTSFGQAHIPGSVRLSNENLQNFMLESDFDAPLLVVCYHGVSSQSAGQYLAEQGFENVYSLDGGMTAWATSFPEQVARD